MQQPKEKGFTFIELMVVMAIMGILISIAIPMFQSYRERASNAQSLSDIRHLYLFESQFFNEYAQYIPIAGADKQASGLISKTVTLLDNSTALFEIRNLSPDVEVAAVTGENHQTIIVGARSGTSNTILAMDVDADGFYQAEATGSFTEADLPAATSENDLVGWSLYQQ